MKPKVILIEFNELCPALLEKWMDAGKLPNFARFFSSSHVFTTESDEPAAPNLEPWIQWYSLHTGLPFKEHGVFHLTDGPKAGHVDIWQTLAASGLTVTNFSSMNARRVEGGDNVFVSDPWCDGQAAYPAELDHFQRYISRRVKEYSNPSAQLTLADHWNFLKFLVSHGLQFKSVVQIGTQLVRELLFDRHSGWKKATFLDRLMFDVFRHFYLKNKPSFATFFCNSTAHFQHSYWRHMDPSAFSVKPSEGEKARYENAILYGYQKMDALLADFAELERDGTTLILATALSQQPFLKWEAIGGQRFYRPLDVAHMLSGFGISYAAIEPVMTHQFVIRFPDAAAADEAVSRLKRLSVNGSPLFGVERRHEDGVLIGNCLRTLVSDDAIITMSGSNETWAFKDVFYLIDATKSGCHHPDGVLWVKTGSHKKHERKISILDVLPTVLDMFSLRPLVALEGRSQWSSIHSTAGKV